MSAAVRRSIMCPQMFFRFGDLHKSAVAGELETWRTTSYGALAEIIILDQFSRNMYRDSPEAFAADPQALELARLAVDKGQDKEIKDPDKLAFLYMPFMHSESKEMHEMAVKLFNQPGLEENYEFESKHKVIIDRFGRYPHRNQVLGRQSTPEEAEFLKEKEKMPYMKRQLQWIARTVMVKENNVEEAMKILNQIVSREGIYKRWMLTRYYEKPWQARQRVNWTKSKEIYNEDMSQKVQFIMRKNRKDPYPGTL